MGKAVIAPFQDDLAAAGVAIHGLAVIEHFIAGFEQQQIAFRAERWWIKRAQLRDVIGGKFKWGAAVQRRLRTKEFVRRDRGNDGGIDQHGTQGVFFSQRRGIEAAQ